MEELMNALKSTALKENGKNNVVLAAVPETFDNEIRNLAYEIHIKRGNTLGSNMDDWLNAEREIRAKYHLNK